MTTQSELTTQFLGSVLTLQFAETAQQTGQLAVNLATGRIGLEDQLDHLPGVQLREINRLNPQPVGIAAADISANTPAARPSVGAGLFCVLPGEGT